jgi:hypothetical protein
MMTIALLTLVFLNIKHWYMDFVDQDPQEIAHKGQYGHWLGIRHSVKHGIGTAVAVALTLGPDMWLVSVMLGMFESVIHYHIDWAKMNWGQRDTRHPSFWAHLGLDQMAHHLTYVGIVAIIVL